MKEIEISHPGEQPVMASKLEDSICTQSIELGKNNEGKTSNVHSVYNQSIKDEFTSEGHQSCEIPGTSGSRSEIKTDVINPYMCTQCHESFPHLARLKRHVETHELYKCHQCGHVSDTDYNFLNHLKKAHKKAKKFVCGVCSEEFKFIPQVRSHMRKHPLKTPYGCGTCGEKVGSIKHIADHKCTHPTDSNQLHGETLLHTPEEDVSDAERQEDKPDPYMCTECHESFSELSDLRSHLAIHEVYKCNQCEIVQDSFSSYISHLNSHRKAETFVCIVCSEEFKHLSRIKTHMKEHPPKTPYGCGICGRQLQSTAHIGRHMSIHSEQTEPTPNSSTQVCESVLANKPEVKNIREKLYKGCTLRRKLCPDISGPKTHVDIQKHVRDKFHGKMDLDTTFHSNSLTEDIEEDLTIEEQTPGEDYTQNIDQDIENEGHYTWLNQYKCAECHDSFPELSDLRNHLAIHELYKCNQCETVWDSYLCFNMHLRTHKKAKKFVCIVCSEEFKLFSQIKMHMREHTPKTPYGCGICGKYFDRAAHITTHMKFHTQYSNDLYEQTPVQPPVVPKSPVQSHQDIHLKPVRDGYQIKPELNTIFQDNENFPYTQNVEGDLIKEGPVEDSAQHVEAGIQNEGHYTCHCTQCNEQFQQVENLKHHIKNHKPHECRVCGALMDCRRHSLEHMKSHKRVRPMICLVCGEAVQNVKNLKKHVMGHHMKTRYGCSLCVRQFECVSNIANHIKFHERLSIDHAEPDRSNLFDITNTSERKLFKCHICGCSFHHVKIMLDHFQTHEERNLCGCMKCGREFISTKLLELHVRKHAMSSPYGCNICGQKYKDFVGLQSHVFTDSKWAPGKMIQNCLQVRDSDDQQDNQGLDWEELSYICTVCTYSCSDLSALAEHVITHPKDKLYKCLKCGEGFSQITDFKHHLTTHEEPTLYECCICDKHFSCRHAFKAHLKIHT